MESGPKWNSLPIEVCEEIFKNLDVESLKNVSLVCKQWCDGSEIVISKRTVLQCHNIIDSINLGHIRSRNLLMNCNGFDDNIESFLNILDNSNVTSVIIQNYPFHGDGIQKLPSLMNILRKKYNLKDLQCTASKRSPEPSNLSTNSGSTFPAVERLVLSHPGEIFNAYFPCFTNLKVLNIQQSRTQKDYDAFIHLIKNNHKTLTEIVIENCVNLSFKVIISIMNLEGLKRFSLKHCSGAYINVSKLLDKYGNSDLLEYFDIENYQYEGLNHYGSVHHHIIK